MIEKLYNIYDNWISTQPAESLNDIITIMIKVFTPIILIGLLLEELAKWINKKLK